MSGQNVGVFVRFPEAGFFPENIELNRRSWRVWHHLPTEAARESFAAMIHAFKGSDVITIDIAKVPLQLTNRFIMDLADVKFLQKCDWYVRTASGPPPVEDRLRYFLFGRLTYHEVLELAELYGEESVQLNGQAIREIRQDYSPTRLMYGSEKNPSIILSRFIEQFNALLVNVHWARNEVLRRVPRATKVEEDRDVET